jgi:hypothetical protein
MTKLVKRWYCDVCKVALFPTLEEACAHEEGCGKQQQIQEAPKLPEPRPAPQLSTKKPAKVIAPASKPNPTFMDHLAGYGSSYSSDEDQPLTTTATPVIKKPAKVMKMSKTIVNPSRREEVWWNNFNSLKRHYDENGSLTFHDTRLSAWLAYQRYSRTLSKEKLQALESIGYKSIKDHPERNEREWEEKFNAIKSNPLIRDRKVQMWLNRQRLQARSDRLSPTRKQRLLDLGINLQPKGRKCGGGLAISTVHEAKWTAMYSELEKYHERFGDVNVPARPRYAEDATLGTWVFNQRKRYHEVRPDGNPVLKENRIELLEKIGFKWNINRRHPGFKSIK